MIEERIEVPRTARYYTLGDLSSASDVLIACHGYAQLARYFLRPFETIVNAERAVVAPEALNRYYFETAPGVHGADARVAATWMTREHREAEITDYVRYLDALAALIRTANPHARLTALGFSQGAQTVSRWAVLGDAALHRLVLWGSGPAHDLAITAASFRQADVVIAAGSRDPHFTPARADGEVQRLRAAGVAAAAFTYDGAHRIEGAALQALVG